MITIRGLNKNFGDKSLLRNVSIKFDSGLNFIVGASGSGKTTLLKILSGMDKDYEGTVLFRGKNIKEYTEEEMNSYYYNHIGFIWQNFHLIDYLTVEENVALVLDLRDDSEEIKKKKTADVLHKLGIEKLAKVRVNTLSGGQKQRVAIARVLVKEPEIIIADEPTGALDKKAAHVTMELLKKVAKNKLVIVVTHDQSLIDSGANVYQLYKGTLVEKSKSHSDTKIVESKGFTKPYLKLKDAMKMTLKSFKGRLYKNILTAVVVSLAALFLVIKLGGQVVNEQQELIDTLIEQRGDKLRDIMIANDRMNTFGADENTAFKQDVSTSLYEYYEDPRIEHFLLVQFINGITINIPGVVEHLEVNCMGTSPSFDALVEGRLPMLEGREVAISSELVKKLGLQPADVIGKTMNVGAWTYDEGSIPRSRVDLELEAITIVGVVDSTINLKNEYGKRVKTNREDTMFFSLELINEIKHAIGSKQGNVAFMMRVREVEEIMPIVEALNAEGIIALGEFEDVKDLLKMSDMAMIGTQAVTSILVVMGIVAVVISSLINCYMRNYEYAVLRINGYSKMSLLKLNVLEGVVLTVVSAITLCMVFIPIDAFLLSRLNIELAGEHAVQLTLGALMLVNSIPVLFGTIASSTVDMSKSLMKGER